MRRQLGVGLIVLGVLAWLPYGVLTHALGLEVEAAPFLAWHLAGVIPGSYLFGGSPAVHMFRLLRQRMRSRSS